MKATAAKVYSHEWLDLNAALKIIAPRGERSLQRLVQAGYVRAQLKPGTREREYNTVDLEDVAESGTQAKRQRSQTEKLLQTISEAVRPPESIAPKPEPLLLEAPNDEQTEPASDRVPQTKKYWLTMQAAEEISGLPRLFIKDLCNAGVVKCLRKTHGTRGWLIQRKSLKDYSRE